MEDRTKRETGKRKRSSGTRTPRVPKRKDFTEEEREAIWENVQKWRSVHPGVPIQIDHADQIAAITRTRFPKVVRDDVIYVKNSMGDKRQSDRKKEKERKKDVLIGALMTQNVQLADKNKEMEKKDKIREGENKVLSSQRAESEEEMKTLRAQMEKAEMKMKELEGQLSIREEEKKSMELVIESMQKNQESDERKRAKGIIEEDELRKQLREAKRRRRKTREEMKERTLRMEALKGELRIAKRDSTEAAKEREKLTEEIQRLEGKVTTNEDESKEQEETIRLMTETLKKLQHENEATEAKNQMAIQMMTKLREEHEELEKKVREERRIVAIATLWEVVRKTQEATENQMTKCYDRFNTIQLMRDVQDWRERLSEEERLAHLSMGRGQRRGTRYDERAYSGHMVDLMRMLRNMSAHMWSHGFSEETTMYEWVDARWGWFWPTITMIATEDRWSERLGYEEYREFVKVHRRNYAWWTTDRRATIDEVELRMMAAEDPMNKLGRLTSTFETGTKEQRERVAKGFWEVVRGFRSCDEKMQDQWVEGVRRVIRKNGIEGWRRVNDEMLAETIAMCPIECGENPDEVMKVILMIEERERQTMNKNRPQFYIRCLSDEWPWVVATTIGLALVYNWPVTEWSVDVYPMLKQQWGNFILWWTGTHPKDQKKMEEEERTRQARKQGMPILV